MKKQFILFMFCLGLAVLQVRAQMTDVNSIAAALPEIQAAPWDLDYQLKLQNTHKPQFADLLRKRRLKRRVSLTDEQIQLQKIKLGGTRISAGKAKTSFRYNPSLRLKDYLLIQSDSAELRKIVEQNADTCLRLFQKALRDNRLAPNDMADASALAFVLSYEVYFGEKPSKTHLNWMRKTGRAVLIKSASFQGVDDAERQRTFEIYGVLTMYSRILQGRGLNGDIAAATEAKETAAEVLKQVWGNSPESIQILPEGFIHRGQKIILDGRATPFFEFNDTLQTAQKLSEGDEKIAREYASYLTNIRQTMAESGLPLNDSAVCGAYSFSQIYPFASGIAGLNQAQFDGVYSSLKKLVLTSADIQAASDNDKQITCELFVIRAEVLKKQLLETPTDAQILANQYLRALFQAYGEEYDNFRMIDDNFVKIGTTTKIAK